MTRIIKNITDIFFKQITDFGGFFFYFLILGTCLFLNELDLFFNLFLSFIFVMALGILIKLVYFKDRPKKQKATNLFEKLDASSFPSVHAMRAVSLAFWLSLFFNNTVFTIYCFAIAIMVMYSRIYLKKHYFIDILGGILFSGIINILIWCYA
ncbi:MAG: phosphatase PAP2 family protein [Candidatus Nanoarchaeia archaeon]|nr:phosphatase PAP2 family protein [Candidatus Nanoarchaeia archaeon]